MDDKSIKSTAEELDIPEEEVRKIIRSIEEKVAINIRKSNLDEIIETRILSFGVFAAKGRQGLQKLKENVRRLNKDDLQRSNEEHEQIN